ncbi:MAG: hypothetical protein WCR30_04530 [Clostridia bacterium]
MEKKSVEEKRENPIKSKEQAIETMNESLVAFSKTLKKDVYNKWNEFVFEKKSQEKQAFESEVLEIFNELGNASVLEQKFNVVADKYRRCLESFRQDCEIELEYISEEIFQKNLDNLKNSIDFMRTINLTQTEKAVVAHSIKVFERNVTLKKFRVAVSKYVKQEEVRISDIQKYFFKRRLFDTIYDEVKAHPCIENFDAAMIEIMSYNSRSYVAQKFLSGMKKKLNKLVYTARDNAIEKTALEQVERVYVIGDSILDDKGKTLTETYATILKRSKRKEKALKKALAKKNQLEKEREEKIAGGKEE